MRVTIMYRINNVMPFSLSWNDDILADYLGPIYQYVLILIQAWIGNRTPSKVWDEINHLFPDVNGAAIV